jgi:hypothetical protein
MTNRLPRLPRGPNAIADEHSMTIKVPIADYRTLQEYAKNRESKPTTVVRAIIAELCRGERNLATHKK